mmetsp:Transcript_51185/g.165775  ORF Transcript_51185/g.165775 Transcript_51185/m.165775 type:complete len:205 (-) Transcript_51185:1393-2007(-)
MRRSWMRSTRACCTVPRSGGGRTASSLGSAASPSALASLVWSAWICRPSRRAWRPPPPLRRPSTAAPAARPRVPARLRPWPRRTWPRGWCGRTRGAASRRLTRWLRQTPSVRAPSGWSSGASTTGRASSERSSASTSRTSQTSACCDGRSRLSRSWTTPTSAASWSTSRQAATSGSSRSSAGAASSAAASRRFRAACRRRRHRC